jgi:hypothetical protein
MRRTQQRINISNIALPDGIEETFTDRPRPAGIGDGISDHDKLAVLVDFHIGLLNRIAIQNRKANPQSAIINPQ